MITPLEAENKKFSKKMMNGYNDQEVDEFLDELIADYGTLYKENSELKEKISVLNETIQHYKTIEDTLQNTLIMAQSTADEIKVVAQSKADQIIQNAEGDARKQVEDLNQKINMKKYELDNMKKDFDVYKAKMESLLISQLELLKEINKNEEE